MRLVIAFSCGLIFFAFPDRLVCAEQESLLRFNWQAGKRYTMSLETSKQLVMENLAPGANKSGENEKREFAVSVLKAGPKEGCELVMECLSTTTKSESNGKVAYSFDSTTDPKKDVGIPIAAMSRAFIGTKIKYLLDSDCKVLRVDGTDELVSKMVAHDPGLKGDTSTPFLKEAKFGTNALIELLQELMVVGLPKKNLKVGDQWTYPTEHKVELAVVESKFSFASLENHLGRDCARIGIDGAIKSSSDRGTLPPGIPMPKVQGQIKGNLWLDTKLEMLVERVTVEETTTAMDMPAVHGKEGETFAIKANQKKTVTYRLLKVEDN